MDPIIRKSVNNKCEPSFSVTGIDDRNFEAGSWKKQVDDPNLSEDPWKYHSMKETGALPYAGRFATYPGKYTFVAFEKTSGSSAHG